MYFLKAGRPNWDISAWHFNMLNKYPLGKLLLIWVVAGYLASCTLTNSTQWILFEHIKNDKIQIQGVTIDGSSPTMLFEFHRGNLYWLSPNGQRIAILVRSSKWGLINGVVYSGRTLVIADMDSGQVIASLDDASQTVTEEIPADENVVWSPNSNSIAFLRNTTSDKSTDLWLYNIESNTTLQLTHDDALDKSPAWSPGGDRLAFVSIPICGNEFWFCPPPENVTNIVTIHQDGSDSEFVAQVPGENLVDDNSIYSRLLCNLLWSPDETFISFENDCGIYTLPYMKELFLVRSDGSQAIQSFTQSVEYAGIRKYSVDWSKSGDKLMIAFSQLPFGTDSMNYAPYGGVKVFESNNFSTLIDIDLPSLQQGAVSWSPDGTYLAWYQTSDDSIGSVFVGSVDRDEIRLLDISAKLPYGACGGPTHTAPVQDVQWSQDGQYLAYTMATQQGSNDNCDPDNERDIAVVSVSDGKFTIVTDSLGGSNRLIGWFPIFAKR